MIRSGCSSAKFCLMALCSFASLNAATESGSPANIALSARGDLPPDHGDRRNARCIAAKTGNIIEILSTVGETEDVHLMLCREMADFIEGGDLIPAVRRKRDTLAHKEYSHQ